MSKAGIEIVTVYRGKDSATYLLSEFQELGHEATPIVVRQYPGENKPYHKIKLEDTDAIAIKTVNQDQGNDMAKWDLKALQRLLEPPEAEQGKQS